MPARAILILLLVALPAQAIERAFGCPLFFRAVANFAYTNQRDRTPLAREFFRVYKNDPLFLPWLREHHTEFPGAEQALAAFAKARAGFEPARPLPPVTVELTGPDLEKPAVRLAEAVTYVEKKGTPTLYESHVLGLRAGDTIVFGEKQFKLGRFLGAGNASHVYELEGRPNEVIKIPFFFKAGELATGREFARRMKAYEYLFSSDVKRAHVVELGEDNRYVIMTKVKGHEDGRDFLQNKFLSQPTKHASREKLLRETIMKAFDLDEMPPYETYVHAARQFLWDGKDWVLVDWE